MKDDIIRKVMDNSLESLVTMRVLAQRLMRRISWDYRFIVGFNSLLIAGGVVGLVPVTTAAYLHNGTTLSVVGLNMRGLLRKSEHLGQVSSGQGAASRLSWS